MAIKMTDCSAENCGDGLVIGKQAQVDVVNFASINNKRFGVAVDNDSEVTLNKVNVVGGGERSVGIAVIDTSLLNYIGLQQDTDIEALKDLIRQLQQTPPDQQRTVILESFLSGANNLTSIANNILQMLPNLPSF